MSRFANRLTAGDILIADGATGTNLQKVGLPAGTHTEDWLFDHPDRILDLEKAFVLAGSDIILTCSFGGNRIRMHGSKYEDRVGEVNRQAAALAREAAAEGKSVMVGGSLGPLGQLMQPYGPITSAEAVGVYAEQAAALAAGEVDLLVIETQFSLEEARAAWEGVRSVTNLPTVVSFSYDRGTRTMMGLKPEIAASTFATLGADMIGANCGTTLENAEEVVKSYAATTPGLPIWVKPNAGLPRLDGSHTVYDITPDQMGAFAHRAVKLGCRVIGGCCGSSPEHVRAMADAASAARL